jgi:hypothetical protein
MNAAEHNASNRACLVVQAQHASDNIMFTKLKMQTVAHAMCAMLYCGGRRRATT